MRPSEYIQKGWCQGITAMSDDGTACSSRQKDAVKWDLAGAIGAAYPEDIQKRMGIADKLGVVLKTRQFAQWNDELKRTKAEVVALLISIGE